MSFEVSANAYDRFMGRYSRGLAGPFADFAHVAAGQRALDVGCGPGALAGELVTRLGADAVSAADPSESFVAAVRKRHPGVDAHVASADALPFADGAFDATLAQLVVPFMADPPAGLRELARVTRAGGVVAACVWDHAGGRTPLTVFWRAVHEFEPGVRDESAVAGAREGQLAELFAAAGLHEIEDTALEVRVEHASFDEWWEPFLLGVGPAGAYVSGLDDAGRAALRERCRHEWPDGPTTLATRAWAARGVAAVGGPS